MTSNNDNLEEVFQNDLEKVLRQNLKLRRELKTRYAPLGVDSVLDLSNVSRRLGLDVASAFPDRFLVRDGLGSPHLVQPRARPVWPWPSAARRPILRVGNLCAYPSPDNLTHI